MNKKSKKVFVGLSGGVDSSVSAALLKKQGFDVTGVYIKTWQPDWLVCTWREERRDSMRVAAKLGIPFLTFDFEKEYKQKVADYMIAEYRAGRTPNPDIMCNKEIKFGSFLKKSLEMGADYIATGHYARISPPPAPPVAGGELLKILSSPPVYRRGRGEGLLEGKDKTKDQSYFLWTLKKEQLEKVIFPVGDLQKKYVRKLAKKFDLPTADKKDSQGICFLGKVDMKDFLKHYIQEKPGQVLNEKGAVIGKHEGVWFYTIGERHGFSISSKTDREEPYYVIAKDIEKNQITVTQKNLNNQTAFAVTKVALKDVNLLDEASEVESGRVRYRQPQQKGLLRQQDNRYVFSFESPQEGVSVGQSVVFYSCEKCLGGGIIETVIA